MGEEGVVLEDEAHAPPFGGKGGDVPALEEDPAGVRGFQPGDDPQKGGLAAARGAQKGQDLPGVDPKIHPLQHLVPAEALPYPLEF